MIKSQDRITILLLHKEASLLFYDNLLNALQIKRLWVNSKSLKKGGSLYG
jgi:hypothetical protein